jgi:hypothetical protein
MLPFLVNLALQSECHSVPPPSSLRRLCALCVSELDFSSVLSASRLASHQISTASVFSFTYKLPIFYLLCFDIHPCNGGGGGYESMRSLKYYFNSLRISLAANNLSSHSSENRPDASLPSSLITVNCPLKTTRLGVTAGSTGGGSDRTAQRRRRPARLGCRARRGRIWFRFGREEGRKRRRLGALRGRIWRERKSRRPRLEETRGRALNTTWGRLLFRLRRCPP